MGIIRLLLALAVVIGHCDSEPLFRHSFMQMTGGRGSVQLFYIISGFYMSLVLNRKYNWKGSHGAFYLNRTLRLFPTYFAVLALTCVGGWLAFRWFGNRFPPQAFWMSHRQHMAPAAVALLVLPQITPLGQDAVMFLSLGGDGHPHLAMNFRTAAPGWKFLVVPQAWTLGVELLFYLVAPFIVRRRTAFIGSLAGIMLVIRILARHRLGLTVDPWTYRFFPFELPLFLMGALAYRIYSRISASGLDRPEIAAVAWAIILLVILLFPELPEHPSIAGLHWSYFVFAGVMPWIFSLTRNWPWERWIGEISYPLYLCHMVVIFFVQAAGVRHHFGLICCGASIGLAVVIHLAIESPIENLRAAIANPRKSESPALQPASDRLVITQQT
jgi:peptidoglycan/LPS O-acetylase OafA/YrhL